MLVVPPLKPRLSVRSVAKVPVWVPIPVLRDGGSNDRVVPTLVAVPVMTNWPVMRVSACSAIGARKRTAIKASDASNFCMENFLRKRLLSHMRTGCNVLVVSVCKSLYICAKLFPSVKSEGAVALGEHGWEIPRGQRV